MINILTGLVIVMVFIYSGIFSTDDDYYPVDCAHVSVYGEDCPTCGLSRSFSEMVRGNFSSASEYNRNGPLLFVFFVSQLFMRTIAGLVLHRMERTGTGNTGLINIPLKGRSGTRYPGSADLKKKTVVLSDAVTSFVLFIVCFRNLLIFWQ
jgi:hypothetical protein